MNEQSMTELAESETSRILSPRARVFLSGTFQFTWLVPPLTTEPLWNGRTSARALLKLLLCAPERQAPRGVLAGILWPETDEAKARESLRAAAKVLRKMLRTAEGEDLLENRQQGEILKLAEQDRLWVDVDAVEDALTRASRGTNPDETLRLLQQAQSWLRGEFLADDLDQEWSGYHWVKQRKQALWMTRCRLVRLLADSYVKHRQIDQAQETLERHIARFPTDQDALYRLLALLERQGCFEQACILYERAKRLLDGKGKKPTEQLKALYERVRNAEPPPAYFSIPNTQEITIKPEAFIRESALSATPPGDPQLENLLPQRSQSLLKAGLLSC
ncbi:MAG: BTAD domain-containing putative transcriptional regulator [Ktedonobacteraceae bacterium]